MNNLSIRKMTEVSKKKKKGFTLVELIIVIAIIAILAAMAIPKFSAVRIEAKVSNDIVAAKNIQTQIALGIANATISVPASGTSTSVAVPQDILAHLDGKGIPEAIPSLVFNYTVDSKGNIIVLAGTNQLYPEETSTTDATTNATTVTKHRQAYLAAAK